MNNLLKIGVATFIALSTMKATELHLSSFATVGGAISNKEYNYQRFINNNGTLRADSVFGVQSDIQFNDNLSATLQGKIAQSAKNDNNLDATVAWAFLAYRPTNDWLIRAGKVRAPLYLNSQNMDIGVTYDMLRLPNEVYSLSPADDGIGAIVTKSFSFDDGELLVDAFYGVIDTPYRVYIRDDLFMYGGFKKGVNFRDIEIKTAGMALTYENNFGDKFRAGFYKSNIKYKNSEGLAGNFSLQQPSALFQSFGIKFPFYQPYGALDKDEVIAFTVGFDYGFDNGYRVVSEYAMRNMVDADTGPNAQSYYITLLKKVENWMPYITFAKLTTKDNVKNLFFTLNSDPVNQFIPVNRQYADFVVASEQKSYTIGTSYSISPSQKIKIEYMRTKIGDVSNFLLDNPDIRNEAINVYSISYNISF